jgi:tRNA nucleotidyltransferase/poly(A) polymerase
VPSPDLNRALRRLDPALSTLLARLGDVTQGETWAVGGFVRDLLARRRPLDLDVGVKADARAQARRFAAALGGHAFPLDEERQTFRVTLPRSAPLSTIDVAVLRGHEIGPDLAARDFTINAMACPLTPGGLGPLLDPFGGREDLRAGLCAWSGRSATRGPAEAAARREVGGRAGHEGRGCYGAGDQGRRFLIRTPRRTAREELMRIFASGNAANGIRLLDSLCLLEVLLPEVIRGRGVEQPGNYHYYDVFDHSIEAVAAGDWVLSGREPRGATARAMRRAFWEALGPFGLGEYFAGPVGGLSRLSLTKFATLLHDVAKPETKGVADDGRIRFLGHAEQGAAISRAICRRLRFGNRETTFVARLVEEHLRPAQLSQSGAHGTSGISLLPRPGRPRRPSWCSAS